MTNNIKVGVIVNPVAGLGGAVGLKGSDGETILAQARARGATPRAGQRVAQFLEALRPLAGHIQWFCWGGPMGEDNLQQAGFAHQVCGQPGPTSGPDDTRQAALALRQAGVDLIVFAGGDGTARDLYRALGTSVPVLGIPAGVKIHSGVYAVHARGAAEIVSKMIHGELVSVAEMEVRDIDEEAFRAGQVRASHFGELLVPAEERYLQHVKCGGREVEALVLEEMAAHLIETLEPERLYILGPGTTTQAIARQLGLDKTLLGVDLLLNDEMVAMDATEGDILHWLARYPGHIIVTLIGGQGHIFGRGNHQIGPPVIRQVGLDQITIVATKTKLKELAGRPLLVDTWDAELNRELSGFLPVITGYEDAVLYPVEG
ncbi:MAG: ATP-NAD kinase family protein [Pseudomonadota bacterium]|nr:ATP-NAD kinase [Pseudomonadales bacterium]MDY6918763.1 ATP-NAD kinase family protein [Pseudomonadota bacterium]